MSDIKELLELCRENETYLANSGFQLISHIEKLEQENAELRAKLEKATDAIYTIASYGVANKFGFDKFVNYEQGWHGVSEYSYKVLKELGGEG